MKRALLVMLVFGIGCGRKHSAAEPIIPPESTTQATGSDELEGAPIATGVQRYDMHLCGTQRVPNDVDACGTACVPCSAPPGGSVECDGVQCLPSCAQGLALEKGQCVPADQCDRSFFFNDVIPQLKTEFPGATVKADFNGDGKLDLAIAAGSLLIFIGNGDGTFADPQTVGSGFVNWPLVAEDFNGDGKLDLAGLVGSPQGSWNPYSIDVLLSRGDGTFEAPQAVGSGFSGGFSGGPVIGDFNGDGKLDLAGFGGPVGSSWSPSSIGSIGVLLSRGDGSFVALPWFSSGCDSYYGIRVADFDQDGKLDLVLGKPYQIQILRGVGDGTFAAGATIALDDRAYNFNSVAVGDFNHDGFIDVAEVDGNSRGLIALGQGDGTFRKGGDFGNSFTRFFVGDFNSDEFPDFACFSSIGVTILLGRSSGNPVESTTLVGHWGEHTVVDWNGDNKADLFLGNPGRGGKDPALFLGDGAGHFVVSWSIDTRYNNPLMTGDFNGDGRVDLLSGVEILLGTQDGYVVTPKLDLHPAWPFSANEAVTLSDFNDHWGLDTADANRVFLASGDFNGDGKLDVADANRIFLSRGDGTFSENIYQSTDSSAPDDIFVGDVNGDQVVDLVQVLFDNNGTSVVFLGKGDGSFGAPITHALPSEGEGHDHSYPRSKLGRGDFNSDGKLDLIRTRYPDSASTLVQVLLGQGDGTFSVGASLTLPGYVVNPIAGDFNGDKQLDVALGDQKDGAVVLLGGGDGTLAALEGAPSNPVYQSDPNALFTLATVGDFNRDGHLDLLEYHTGWFTTIGTILLGQGDGTFVAKPLVSPPIHLSGVQVQDMNGDGNPDLVFSRTYGLTVLWGANDGTFGDGDSYPVPDTLAASVGDFDSDGRLDVYVRTARVETMAMGTVMLWPNHCSK